MHTLKVIFPALLLGSAVSFGLSTAFAKTERISVANDGSEGQGSAAFPHTNQDGRYVTFSSSASNLVTGDTNNISDVFLRDTLLGTTQRINIAYDGSQANYTLEGSFSLPWSSISADGRYIAFDSSSTNLVKDDTNNVRDIFLRDTLLNTTTRISVASDGSEGNGYSFYPIISGNGRYVLFSSRATNLVTGDTNDALDIFVHDIQTGVTERVSVASDGSQANADSYFYDAERAISYDGRYAVFTSDATNLVTSDTNAQTDVFWHDRATGKTEVVSVAADGTQANNFTFYPSVSDDGCRIAFESYASNLVNNDTNNSDDAFMHDRCLNTTERISVDGLDQQTEGAFEPEISPDGRYVAFGPISTYWFGTAIAVRDTLNHETVRISNAPDGKPASDGSGHASFSGDGKFIVFNSSASNLVAMDTNAATDSFKARNNRAPKGTMAVTSLFSDLMRFEAKGAIDPDGTLVDYRWDFGDGQSAHGLNVTHRFLESGTFNVTLTLLDDDGATTVLTRSVLATPSVHPTY